MSYSRLSLMIISSVSQFHIERPWGQPGEGPSRGLLRDYVPSDSLFEALVGTGDLVTFLLSGWSTAARPYPAARGSRGTK